jgi:hypothetical protein
VPANWHQEVIVANSPKENKPEQAVLSILPAAFGYELS